MIWQELIQGFTSGFVEGAANYMASSERAVERGRIERLCAELGWDVDECDGKSIRLHFKDPLFGIRKVCINDGDGPVVILAAYSYAIVAASAVPKNLPPSLLMRNAELALGAWEAFVDDDKVFFRVAYCALGNGLDARTFKFICEKLSAEAGAIDQKMQAAGLLGSR